MPTIGVPACTEISTAAPVSRPSVSRDPPTRSTVAATVGDGLGHERGRLLHGGFDVAARWLRPRRRRRQNTETHQPRQATHRDLTARGRYPYGDRREESQGRKVDMPLWKPRLRDIRTTPAVNHFHASRHQGGRHARPLGAATGAGNGCCAGIGPRLSSRTAGHSRAGNGGPPAMSWRAHLLGVVVATPSWAAPQAPRRQPRPRSRSVRLRRRWHPPMPPRPRIRDSATSQGRSRSPMAAGKAPRTWRAAPRGQASRWYATRSSVATSTVMAQARQPSWSA